MRAAFHGNRHNTALQRWAAFLLSCSYVFIRPDRAKGSVVSKKPTFHFIFAEKIVLKRKSITPNRDNFRINYALKCPD